MDCELKMKGRGKGGRVSLRCTHCCEACEQQIQSLALQEFKTS